MYKCNACQKASVFPWYVTAISYVKALWTFYIKLDARTRAQVRAAMKAKVIKVGPGPRPVVTHEVRFLCAKCQTFIPPSTWWSRAKWVPDRLKRRGIWLAKNNFDVNPGTDQTARNESAKDGSGLDLRFRIRCHGEETTWASTAVAIYFDPRCHEVVFAR